MSRFLAFLFLAIGLVLLGVEVRLEIKGRIAALSIDRAFAAHLEDGQPHLPWPWADFHPIARLRVERLGLERTVVTGASGGSLAFGVGRVDGTADPNDAGNCVLAGHRDGAFGFLENLSVGDRVGLVTPDGDASYRVVRASVVKDTDLRALEPTSDRVLTLVTCYPFGSVFPSRERYIVRCHRDDSCQNTS